LGTISEVDDEATQLMLETLVVVGIDDEDGSGEEEKEEDS
jgi:hypothetical protein